MDDLGQSAPLCLASFPVCLSFLWCLLNISPQTPDEESIYSVAEKVMERNNRMVVLKGSIEIFCARPALSFDRERNWGLVRGCIRISVRSPPSSSLLDCHKITAHSASVVPGLLLFRLDSSPSLCLCFFFFFGLAVEYLSLSSTIWSWNNGQ